VDNLPTSSHLHNFVGDNDIINIFEPQLKQVQRDRLREDQISWLALKNYLVESVLIIIRYFIEKNIERTIYNNAKRTQRTEWRSAVLSDLHAIDRITVDVRAISESGTTIAQNINIRSYMGW
jgi:hypothetical protein